MRAIPTAATYASIVTSAASAADQQIGDTHTEVKYPNEDTDAVDKAPELNSRRREPDTGKLQTGAPSATENENPQLLAEGLDTVLHEAMHYDSLLDRKEALDTETMLSKQRVRRKGEQSSQHDRTGTPCMLQPREDRKHEWQRRYENG